MDDRALRSLSKDQMLRIMHQQEIEIERLTAERDGLSERLNERLLKLAQAGSIAEASLQLSGVLQAAQNAADLYLESVRLVADEEKAATIQLENEARDKIQAMFDEAKQKHEKATTTLRQVMGDMQHFIDWHMERLVAVRSDFQEMLHQTDLVDPVQTDKPEEDKA